MDEHTFEAIVTEVAKRQNKRHQEHYDEIEHIPNWEDYSPEGQESRKLRVRQILRDGFDIAASIT